MKFITIEIDPDPETPFTPLGAYDNRTDADTAAKEYVTRFPGSRTGIYRYEHGYSSKSQVMVSSEYYPPEPPVEKAPESSNTGLTD